MPFELWTVPSAATVPMRYRLQVDYDLDATTEEEGPPSVGQGSGRGTSMAVQDCLEAPRATKAEVWQNARARTTTHNAWKRRQHLRESIRTTATQRLKAPSAKLH